jgi:hypothetical protein
MAQRPGEAVELALDEGRLKTRTTGLGMKG